MKFWILKFLLVVFSLPVLGEEAASPGVTSVIADQVVISQVPASQEKSFLKNLKERLLKSPRSRVLIATTGSSDPMTQTPEFQDLTKSSQVQTVQAKSLEELPTTEKSRSFKTRLLNLKQKRNLLGAEQATAIAVSVIPAGNYGTLVYLMSADAVLASASFGVVMAVNVFQALFTEKWLQFTALGERGGEKVLTLLGRIVGKETSPKARSLAGSFGRIGIVVGMNTALAAIQMTLSGTLDSAWALIYFGYSSSYDMWDSVMEEKMKTSPLLKRYFVHSRLAIGSLIECLALAGNGVAEATLVVASVSSTLGVVFKSLSQPERPSLMQRLRFKMKSWTRFLDAPPDSCLHFLL
jgi:hypothetical protein